MGLASVNKGRKRSAGSASRKRRKPGRALSSTSLGEPMCNWAEEDMQLMDSSAPQQRNKFFAREIEVSAEEFEECRELYLSSVKETGGEMPKEFAEIDIAEDLSIKGSIRLSGEKRSIDFGSRTGAIPLHLRNSMNVNGASSPTSPVRLGASRDTVTSATSEGSTKRQGAPLARSSSIMLQMPKKEQRSQRYRSCMGAPIISPFNKAYLIWRWIILALDATYAAFLVPIHAAVQPHQEEGQISWLEVVAIASTLLYGMDMMIQFNVAWIAYSQDLKQVLVLDGKKIAKFYLKKGFIIDFLTIVPMLMDIMIRISLASMDTDTMPEWVVVVSPWIRGLRLLRFIRVFHICRLDFLTRITGRMDVFSPAVSSLVMLLYFIAFMVNLLGCIWYIIGWYGGYQDSWLTTKNVLVQVGTTPDGDPELEELPLSEVGFTTQFVAALYWATTTVTTVGYGDIVPANTFEMAIAIIVEFMGVLIFGLLIGILSSIFMTNSKEARRSQALQDRIQEANEWMLARRMPKDVRKKVRMFYTDVWQRQVMAHDDAKMLSDLPYSLRSEVSMSILRSSLRKCPQSLLRCLPRAIQQLVVAAMVPVTVCSGHDLVTEGSPAQCIWLLQTGEMAELHQYRVASLQTAPHFLGLLNLADVLTDREDGIGKPSYSGYRSIGMSMAWRVELCELLRLGTAFPEIQPRIVKSALEFLETCMLSPSPVEQYNDTVERLHKRLQEAPSDDVRNGTAFNSSMPNLDTSLVGLSKSNLDRLRTHELQMDVCAKLRGLLEQRRSRGPQPLPDDIASRPPWQRVALYMRSGDLAARGRSLLKVSFTPSHAGNIK